MEQVSADLIHNVKYANHLNVVVVIVGVIVIAQTLTQTFWDSAPEKNYSVKVSASQPRILQIQAPRPATGSQKRSAAPTSGIAPGSIPPSSVQTSGSGAFEGRNRLTTVPPVQQTPGRGAAGSPAATTSSAPTVVTIPAGPTTAPPSGDRLQGEAAGRSLRQLPLGGRLNPRSQGSAESRSLNLPPPGPNDSAKRQSDPNAPTPPVRSSMPEPRNQ